MAEPPTQIAVGDETIDTVGLGLTITLTVAKLEQELALVPDTVYEVVTLGETITSELVAPVFQEYVEAPEAVNVAEPPAQIAVGDETIETVGLGLTITLTVAKLEHAFALIPDTV